MKTTRMLTSAGSILGLCAIAATAVAQTGTVSDFSGASVASSALMGPFGRRASVPAANLTLVTAAMRGMAFKLGVSLDAGTIAGGGFTTHGRSVQALGLLMRGSTTPTADARTAIARAFRPSGASAAQIDRLVSALAGLLSNTTTASLPGEPGGPDLRAWVAPSPTDPTGGPDAENGAAPSRLLAASAARSLPRISTVAVDEAEAAFRDFVNSASAAFLSHPPEEFRATYSALYELLCAENTAAGVTVAMCAPPNFVIDQPPPKPLVNQDSIDAAERALAAAAAARARADSIAAAAARAHEDSVTAAARAIETVRARAVLETRVFFDLGQFSLDADAKAALDAKLRVLQANPDVRIRVEGNVDPSESDAFNHLLGRFRAEQARSYLVAHGISVNRVDIVDNRASHAVCTQRRESCSSRNRRDEFSIVAGGGQMRLPK